MCSYGGWGWVGEVKGGKGGLWSQRGKKGGQGGEVGTGVGTAKGYVQAIVVTPPPLNKLPLSYAAPIGAFFCPEIRAFTGVGARFLQPFPKSLVTVKYNSNTKMAVDGR